MQNLNLYELKLIWPDLDVWRISKLRVRKYAIEISSLRLVWAKYESCILHAESLSLVWMKYESYILHTSAVMYFSKLKDSC